MKASEIIERARSLADLQTSKAVTYSDEKNSLNEAYRLVYNKLCDSDDDFFLNDFSISNLAAYSTAMPYNYEVPLPADFYKLRTVSYSWQGQWYPMSRTPLNMRNVNTSEPMYRLKNNVLWITCGSTTQVSEVKIGYYPPPAIASVPDVPSSFGLSLSPASQIDVTHTAPNADTLYVASGNTIISYMRNKTGSTLVYTGAAGISRPVYYKGYLFFFEGSDLNRLDIVSLSISTVRFSATLAPFTVQDDIIYYVASGNTYSNSILGGSETTLFPGEARTCMYKLGSSSYAYIKGGNYEIDGVIQHAASFLSYPYYVYGDSTYNTDGTLFALNIQIGNIWNSRAVAVNALSRDIGTISTATDTQFSFPTNVLYEILSYQAASDFKRKYEEVSADLEAKLAQLWDAFTHSVIRRDEYKPEKIQNVYNTGSAWGNF